MKILFFTLLMFLTLQARADQFVIPFDCYPKQIQEDFENRGYKLDLDGNERTKESWGFIENKGAEFIIYTYRSATDEELRMIIEVVNKER